MKGGAAIHLSLLEQYTEDPHFKGILLLLGLPDEENLSAGLQQLLVQLTSLSQALEQRSARLSRREAGYAEAGTLLLGAQEKLATQLDYLSTRLSGLQEESNDKNSTRASA